MSPAGGKSGGAFLEVIMRETLRQMSEHRRGFDKVIKGCEIVETAPGRCLVSYSVNNPNVLSNVGGRVNHLHSGFLATLIDCIVTCVQAEAGHKSFADIRAKIGTTTNFRLSFMAPIVLGDELLLDVRALRLADQMAHMECRVTKKGDEGGEDKLMALAVQTRYVPKKLPEMVQRQVDEYRKAEEERAKKK